MPGWIDGWVGWKEIYKGAYCSLWIRYASPRALPRVSSVAEKRGRAQNFKALPTIPLNRGRDSGGGVVTREWVGAAVDGVPRSKWVFLQFSQRMNDF